jgi:hypothetical protein
VSVEWTPALLYAVKSNLEVFSEFAHCTRKQSAHQEVLSHLMFTDLISNIFKLCNVTGMNIDVGLYVFF